MPNTIEDAVLFLFQNARHRPRDINRAQLKQAIATVEKAAADGLSNEVITSLATKIIFAGAYDVAVRRKLLYSLVPQTEDFPYKIIPIAVSTITCVPMSSAWQHAVLAWLGSLLEYGIVNSRNRYIHLCYTSVLNFMQHLNLVKMFIVFIFFSVSAFFTVSTVFSSSTGLGLSPDIQEKVPLTPKKPKDILGCCKASFRWLGRLLGPRQ
ncbi:uncharacterized protein LOC119578506 [Penaeus monodon]|uniref:uncharacterized protein LOC119578506 n=1 Tax=Penaeus monodon TaxID=6687 RepID=UPI0018A76609|nr:uncharacterized protein LOC119578506 [Penaeus monodon]